ncbi:beta-lactamase superfamily domain-containing protein [Limtongia smithiae]|uniref:beta-lactamase superfamily domain-containing protein n=1 Tax=Limtongia smithiae TaxID=1125753 RepID=UPI0034CD889E
MGVKANVTLVFVTAYSIYYGYINYARMYAVSTRAARAKRAREGELDVEDINSASPTEQYAVLLVGGRFVNPFPEYREQGIFEFIFWKLFEVIRWSPRGGVPRDRALLKTMIPVYKPDMEILFDTTSTSGSGAGSDADGGVLEGTLASAGTSGLSSSVTSAIYYSSDTGSSATFALDSPALTDSWTAVNSSRHATGTSPLGRDLVSDAGSDSTASDSAGSVPYPPSSEGPASIGGGSRFGDIPAQELPLVMPAKDERLTVTWIGQSCMLVQCRGTNFLTDPVFGEHLVHAHFGPSRLGELPCKLEELPPIDFVLVSHNHPDHFEDAAVRQIGNSATWIVPAGVRSFLARRGIFRVMEMTWWDRAPLQTKGDGWEIACTPSMHWSGRGLFDTNVSLWCSFMILHHSRPVVFHAGDTGYSTEMFTAIAQVYGPGCELALVPCGAYEPRFHLRPIHTNPEEALKIMHDLGARRLVGVHHGTFTMSDEYFLEPKRRLENEAARCGLSDAVWGAEFGRTVVVPYRVRDEGSVEEGGEGAGVGPIRGIQGRDTLIW